MLYEIQGFLYKGKTYTNTKEDDNIPFIFLYYNFRGVKMEKLSGKKIIKNYKI